MPPTPAPSVLSQTKQAMPYSLKGRNVLVTGGSRGLGAIICEKFAAEGCNVAINYANNETAAKSVAQKLETEHGVKAVVLKADCGVTAEIEALVADTIKAFGGLDIIIGNAGWTRFSDFGDLHAMAEEEWDKCWAVNVKGQMALLRSSLPTFNANEQGGVFIITSSIAGTSTGGSSMPYSITKAAQLHLMRCLASTQGPKVRVNAVLPGLLLTDWGKLYSEQTIAGLKDRAALKQTTDLEDCADIYVSIAKNTSMTGQRIAVDAGLNIAAF